MGNTIYAFLLGVLLAYVVAQGSLKAQQDPFKRVPKSPENTAPNTATNPESVGSSPLEWRNKLQRFFLMPPWFREWQRNIQSQVSATALKIKQNNWSKSWYLYALSLAIAFGFLHIVGPGHGKVFTISYLMSHRATLKEGLWLSIWINIVDSLSAGLVVFLIYGVLNLNFGERQWVEAIIAMLSYGIIVVWSAGHLLLHLFKGYSCPHHREHSCSSENHKASTPSQTRTGRHTWYFALGIGLVPCPISTALLIFGLLNQMLGLSIFLVVGVSIGGMIAMTFLNFAVIGGKKGVYTLLYGFFLEGSHASRKSKLIGILSKILEILALLLMIVIGSIFFLLSYPIY